ncbi:MAG: ribonucleoside-diphosphate reductase subunit alpha [Nanopusillaceae archaeon]
MYVEKRDGRKEKVDINKIRKVLLFTTEGLNDVDFLEIELDAQIHFYDGIKTKDIHKILIDTAISKISVATPNYSYVASRLMLYDLYKEISYKRKLKIKEKKRYGDYIFEIYNPEKFYETLIDLVEKNIYGKYLIENYSKDEMFELFSYIQPKRDYKFTYAGIKTLIDRYLVKDLDGKVAELPQEMYMLIAMTLAIPESKEKRVEYAKKFYDLLSEHKVSVATPILLNARRNELQLSSCFVLTIDDDLHNIFENITHSALISKFAGGLGIYIGKLRGMGAPIRGYQNASSGIIPVVKVINDVMVYVNQLGIRKGSASITLDIWHTDILDFLEIKTNAGDERKKAHDIHPAISIPDIFMKRLLNKEDFTLFNPYYTKNVKDGKNLEDFYGEEFEELYLKLEKELPEKAKIRINSFKLWKMLLTVIFETGEPYVFFRDTANRLNPNKHKGMIYSSNLCMEITQNMKPFVIENQRIESDKCVKERRFGDVVVCNLGAINLGVIDDFSELEEIARYLVRMIDNTIDINNLPIPDAVYTNKKYRSIGIGVANYHYHLAKKNIKFDSEENIEYTDKLFENIAYYVLKASNELAKEKGMYEYFDGSDWSKGIFFGRSVEEIQKESMEKGTNLDWIGLYENIKKHGLRNAYLLALMPTGSTSIIIGATPSIEPVFARFYKEENQSGIIPQVPPEVDKYFWFYKPAYDINQEFIIRLASVRQKWIDQAQSLTLFIKPEEITGGDLSNLYILAWKSGLKTIYYVRSRSKTDITDDCEMCST